MPNAVLIIPPHIQNKFLDLFRIEVACDFLLPLNLDLSLSLGEEKSHAPVERPLSGDRPAQHHGVPGEESVRALAKAE